MIERRIHATDRVRKARVPLIALVVFMQACDAGDSTAPAPPGMLLAEFRWHERSSLCCGDWPAPVTAAICLAYDWERFFEAGTSTPPAVNAGLTMGCDARYAAGDDLTADFRSGDPGFVEIVARLTDGVSERLSVPMIPLDGQRRIAPAPKSSSWGRAGEFGDLLSESHIELIRLRIDSLRLTQDVVAPGEHENGWALAGTWEFWGR